MRILLDTSVFISILSKDGHISKSIQLFKKVIERHEGFFCSMTINELVWVLKRSDYDAKFICDKIEFIFSPPLKFLAADKAVFMASIEQMEKYGLSYGDSQIVAQAIVNGLDCIASFDKDFDKVEEIERIESI